MPKSLGKKVNPQKVLAVHGRNKAAQTAIFDFLSALGLKPIEWEEAIKLTGEGTPYIGDVLDAAFSKAQAVIVILTGDDEARLRAQFQKDNDPVHEKELTPQPRANVIFEAGLAFGRDPKRTILVEIGSTRPFSDILVLDHGDGLM